MKKTTYALYARAIHGPQVGEFVMCWNFDDEALATAVALQRVYDVGEIIMYRHVYGPADVNEPVSREEMKTFIRPIKVPGT
jgi:hypothetical protein